MSKYSFIACLLMIVASGVSAASIKKSAVNEVVVTGVEAASVKAGSASYVKPSSVSNNQVSTLKETKVASTSVEANVVAVTTNKATSVEVVNKGQDSFYMLSGWLRDNVSRLAKELNVSKVVWHSKVPSCYDWKVEGDDIIPHSKVENVFGYVFDQYPLFPKYHPKNNVLVILPLKVFKECPDA